MLRGFLLLLATTTAVKLPVDTAAEKSADWADLGKMGEEAKAAMKKKMLKELEKENGGPLDNDEKMQLNSFFLDDADVAEYEKKILKKLKKAYKHMRKSHKK